MKKLNTFLTLLLTIVTLTTIYAKPFIHSPGKDPIVMEAMTKYTTVAEALTATKSVLLLQKFILQGEIGASSFTAKRTTGAEADYYIADVAASIVEGKAKVTITFVKVGTGLLKLQKVADEIKLELEK